MFDYYDMDNVCPPVSVRHFCSLRSVVRNKREKGFDETDFVTVRIPKWENMVTQSLFIIYLNALGVTTELTRLEK